MTNGSKALYTVEEVKNEDVSRWDAYVEQHEDGTLYHKIAWASLIKRTLGQKPRYIIAKNFSGTVVGVLPLVNLKSMAFGNFLVSMPYFNYGGVLADNAEVSTALVNAATRLADSLKVSHVQFRCTEESMPSDLHLSTHKVNMILDLPESQEALGKSIGSKRRSQIKRPIREGVSHRIGGKELLDDFYDVFCQNMRDLGTPVYSKKLFADILNTFEANARICVVYWEGKPVSTGFLMHYKNKLEIPWASTVRYANRISVNMYLYWQILSYAIEEGFKQFDFGRSSIDAGTYKFKKQWGAQPHQCYWYHYVPEGKALPDLSPDNESFGLAIKVWQKLPIGVTKLIGPHIVKAIP
jgi:serine/alanine adding enzyme